MPRRLHAASHVIRTRPTRGRRRAISSPARVSSSSSAPLEVVACRSTRLSFMTGSRPKTCCAPIRLWSSRLAQPRQSTVRTDRRILEATSAGAVRCRHQHEAGVERAHPSRDRDKVESELQAIWTAPRLDSKANIAFCIATPRIAGFSLAQRRCATPMAAPIA
jgi:hypothetical protein